MKSLFEEICKNIEGYSVPKQFAAESLEAVEVISTVSAEDAMKMNHEFQKICDLIQAEECQSDASMNKIIAGSSYTKKLGSNFIK